MYSTTIMNSPESFVLIMYKVRIPGERFWINVLGEDNNHVYGTVANCLINTNQYQYGDLVKWHKRDKELSSIEYSNCTKTLINHLDSPISTLEIPIDHNMIARWVPIRTKRHYK